MFLFGIYYLFLLNNARRTTSTKFVHSCVSYAKLYNLKHIFQRFSRAFWNLNDKFSNISWKYLLKLCVLLLYVLQINLKLKIIQQIWLFAFIHISKIKSIHYVKLYISRLCIPNIIFGFCALPKSYFLTCGFLFPVSTVNIITGLRSFLLW